MLHTEPAGHGAQLLVLSRANEPAEQGTQVWVLKSVLGMGLTMGMVPTEQDNGSWSECPPKYTLAPLTAITVPSAFRPMDRIAKPPLGSTTALDRAQNDSSPNRSLSSDLGALGFVL